jgi:hypothetical protein
MISYSCGEGEEGERATFDSIRTGICVGEVGRAAEVAGGAAVLLVVAVGGVGAVRAHAHGAGSSCWRRRRSARARSQGW